MSAQSSYGTLSQVDDETLEFVVNGKLQRAWRLGPPLREMADLLQRCLDNLGHEGWRPISHHGGAPDTIVLARVPYTAGSKLSVFGTLRFATNGPLVLTVAGATMQTWPVHGDTSEMLSAGIAELESKGWRLHRRYKNGATVVRG